jgi:hypothetical protein
MVTPNQHKRPVDRRWKRMPARDEHGQLRVSYEYRPAPALLDRERFDDLARLLYQRWVVEPSPFVSGDTTPITRSGAEQVLSSMNALAESTNVSALPPAATFSTRKSFPVPTEFAHV